MAESVPGEMIIGMCSLTDLGMFPIYLFIYLGRFGFLFFFLFCCCPVIDRFMQCCKDFRKAALPVGAASFGALLPALLDIKMHVGTVEAHGWPRLDR